MVRARVGALGNIQVFWTFLPSWYSVGLRRVFCIVASVGCSGGGGAGRAGVGGGGW